MSSPVLPPLHRAAEPQTLLAGYTNTIPILVVDGDGAPLPLTGAEITADVDTLGGRSLGSPTVTVTDAEGGALTVSIAPGGMPQSGNRGHVGVRFDLGAGVVFEVQAEVRVQTGVAPDAGGGTYTLPTLTVTVSGAEGVDVGVQWRDVLAVADGEDGADGLSAYEVAVANGFEGSEAEWLASLVGPQGPEGPQGPAGEDGAAATVAVGDVATLPAGSPATVTNAGTPSAAVLDFGIPAGPQGDQGEPGPQGEAGPQGEQGPAGDDGADGWSPTLAAVEDGERRVLQVADWQGGEGDKPATGLYLGAAGLVSDIGEAVDVRGAAGADGLGVPDPSAEDDGLVLTTEGGAAVWAPSAGVTAREVAALGLSDIDSWDTLRGTGSLSGRVAPSGDTWEVVSGAPVLTSRGVTGDGVALLGAVRRGVRMLVTGSPITDAVSAVRVMLLPLYIDSANYVQVEVNWEAVRVTEVVAGVPTVIYSQTGLPYTAGMPLRATIECFGRSFGSQTYRVFVSTVRHSSGPVVTSFEVASAMPRQGLLTNAYPMSDLSIYAYNG